jgi:hypothetical protein
MAGMIDDYLATLRRDLAFDPALAERMAEEVEAHLREAAEADPAWPSPDAERRAVERFGLAREIAGQFATDAVSRQARRSWIALLATVAMTFVAMRLRVIWLGEVGDTLSMIAPLVDRYAFIAALGIAAVGWFTFRNSLLPLAISVTALIASIAAGICRAGLFLGAAAPLPVLLAAAIEVALVGLLAFQVVGLGRRLRRTATLRRIP